MTKKTPFALYALAVCFASTIFILVNVAICLYGGLQIVGPGLTVGSFEFERSLSDEAFLRRWSCDRPRPDAAAVPALRRTAFAEALAVERHDGRRSVVQSLFYVLSAGVAFWLHWKLARSEQRNGTLP